jgi:hypothetical protein
MNNRAVDDSTGPTGMGFEFLRPANSIPVKRMFVRDAYQAWYQRGLPGTEETLLGAQALIQCEVDDCGEKSSLFEGGRIGRRLGQRGEHPWQVGLGEQHLSRL